MRTTADCAMQMVFCAAAFLSGATWSLTVSCTCSCRDRSWLQERLLMLSGPHWSAVLRLSSRPVSRASRVPAHWRRISPAACRRRIGCTSKGRVCVSVAADHAERSNSRAMLRFSIWPRHGSSGRPGYLCRCATAGARWVAIAREDSPNARRIRIPCCCRRRFPSHDGRASADFLRARVRRVLVAVRARRTRTAQAP